MYKCGWWKKYITHKIVKQHLRESILYKKPRREEKLLENINSGNLFGYVQCDIEVPGNLRDTFANFTPIFKIFNVGRDDIRPIIKDYADKEGLLT